MIGGSGDMAALEAEHVAPEPRDRLPRNLPMMDRLAYEVTTLGGPTTDEPYDLARWFCRAVAKELRREANKPENRSERANPYDAGYDAGVNAVIRLLYKEARR